MQTLKTISNFIKFRLRTVYLSQKRPDKFVESMKSFYLGQIIFKDRILSNLDIIISSPKASLNPKTSTLNPKLAKMDDLTAMIMM